MRDANDLSDYVDYSSFPKQRLLIYSIRHQNGITRRKYIYIYIYRVPSKYFFRWSIYFRSPFSSSAFICHSLPPRRFFPRLSCRHLHLYRDCYPFFSSIFRKLRICIISQHRKVSVIREWNTKRIGGDWMNFFSRIHKRDFHSLQSSFAMFPRYLLLS